MRNSTTDSIRSRQDEALLRSVVLHGVPVRVMADAMGVCRQTVYRRMQRARTRLRRRAEAEARRRGDDD